MTRNDWTDAQSDHVFMDIMLLKMLIEGVQNFRTLFSKERRGETTWRQPFDPQKLQCRPKKFSFGSFNDVVQRTKIIEPISGQESKAVGIKKHHRMDESQTPINHANRNETLITIIKSSNSCAQSGLKRHVSFTGPTEINKKTQS